MTERRQEQEGTPRDTDPLDELLQKHIQNCRRCQEAITDGPPIGFGRKSNMCEEYFNLVRIWSGNMP